MILTIVFENYKGEEQSFDWELVDTRYAKAWKDLMLDWKDQWKLGVPEFKDKWFISSTNEDFSNYIKEIKQNFKHNYFLKIIKYFIPHICLCGIFCFLYDFSWLITHRA